MTEPEDILSKSVEGLGVTEEGLYVPFRDTSGAARALLIPLTTEQLLWLASHLLALAAGRLRDARPEAEHGREKGEAK